MDTPNLHPEVRSANLGKVFNLKFEEQQVSTVEYKGQLAWIARQIGEALGYAQEGKRFTTQLSKWELVEGVDFAQLQGDELEALNFGGTDLVPAKTTHLTLIFESGLWLALAHVRSEVGKRFRRWLSTEVMPSIRKTGTYTLVPPVPSSQALPTPPVRPAFVLPKDKPPVKATGNYTQEEAHLEAFEAGQTKTRPESRQIIFARTITMIRRGMSQEDREEAVKILKSIHPMAIPEYEGSPYAIAMDTAMLILRNMSAESLWRAFDKISAFKIETVAKDPDSTHLFRMICNQISDMPTPQLAQVLAKVYELR